MTLRLAVIALLFFAVGTATEAFSAGFHIREQGAKAMGMANAFVAQADDPSAVFYNPAGLSFQEGSWVSLGVTVIKVPETEFEGTTQVGENEDNGLPGVTTTVDEKARKDIFFPPNFYITNSMEGSPWAIGFGVNSLFPLAKRWNATSPFRDEVKEIAIKPINFNPTVAYRIDRFNLSLAAGVDYTYARVWLEQSPSLQTGPDSAVQLGDLEIEGDGDGWGYNFGLMWKPLKSLSIGVAYRSEIELDIDGDADYLDFTGGMIPGAPGSFGTDASTEITLPDTWSFGAAWRPVEKLVVEFDADRFGWSSYDELAIELGVGSTTSSLKDWDDVWAYRVGAQYSVTSHFDLRAGYTYDNSPMPEETMGPELPDSDRHNYTLGFGYHNGRTAFDFAYMLVDFKDRKVDNEIQTGEYRSEAHVFGANVTFRF